MASKDYTGQKFGKLTVVKGGQSNTSRNKPNLYKTYICQCDCSTIMEVATSQLNRGTKSCGCLKVFNNLTDKLYPGLKINRFTVVKFCEDKLKWELKCDCGNIYYPDTAKVILNNNTKSCGCLNAENGRKQAIKLINSRSDPEPKKVLAMRVHRNNYSDADLSFEDFLILSQEPCSYCGAIQTCSTVKDPSKYSYLSKLPIEDLTFGYNGLDRVDNNFGHSLNNCITACILCNRAKNDYTITEFVAHLQRLVQRKSLNHISLEEYRAQHKNIAIEFFNNPKTYYSKIASIKYRQNSVAYKDIDFDIKTFYQLTQLSCFYCGIEPQNHINKAKNKKNSGRAVTDYAISTGEFIYSGLDRLDSSLPHHYSNIIPCCGQCNCAKGKLTFAQFNEWIDRVANYLFPELINDKPQTSPPPSL